MPTPELQDPVMYVSSMDIFVNRWFVRYEEALSSLEKEGGYLFPFRNQFFVTESEAIRELGLDPLDPDWELIGWNWARPLDKNAWLRLRDKHLRALADSSGGSGRKP